MGGKHCVILKRKHQVHNPLLAELPFLEGRLLEQGLRETGVFHWFGSSLRNYEQQTQEQIRCL